MLVVLRSLRGKDIQVMRPAFDRFARVDLAVQDRCGVFNDVVDIGDVGLEVTGDRLSRVDQPLQRGAQPADRLGCLVEQLADLLLGQYGQAAVSGVQRRPNFSGHGGLGDGLSRREILARVAFRHQVQILLADCRHRMHVRRRIDRDLVSVADTHGRLHTGLGRLDGCDPANGLTAIGHVGRLVQTARRGQVRLQRVLADPHRGGNP